MSTQLETRLFKDIEPVAGMTLKLCSKEFPQGYTVVKLTRPMVNGGTGWYGRDADGYMHYIPEFWAVQELSTSPAQGTTLPELKTITYEQHEQRARELMRESYKRGRRDASRRVYELIRSTFGPEFLLMVLDNIGEDIAG